MAGRGKDWEATVSRSFDMFGDHTVVKTDPPVVTTGWNKKSHSFTGRFAAPGMCDFEGGFLGVPVCIDAKETKKARYNFKTNHRDNQWDRMKLTHEMGGIAGYLIRFRRPAANDDRAYFMPWVCMEDLKKLGTKSFAADGLLGAWPVKIGACGSGVVLPGLHALLVLFYAKHGEWRRGDVSP